MPKRTLSVSLMTLREIFSAAFAFQLPWFQRAYAWQTAQAGRLLADVSEEMDRPDACRYQLGNLMLAQRDLNRTDASTADANRLAIIDGHQRLMTLTILFAVLRDLEDDPTIKAEYADLIVAAPTSRRAVETYRLAPQPRLTEFLAAHVQREGATAVAPDMDCDAMSETERNIIENRDLLRTELEAADVSIERRRALARFLLDECTAIVRLASSEDWAWQMLRIEETTRLDFTAADSAKASLLGVMAPADRNEAARIWEDCESRLGSTQTYELLSHVRIIGLRRRTSAPIETDLCRSFELDRSGLAFMRDILAPHAAALARLREAESAAETDPTWRDILAARNLMGWINHQSWLPAAVHWLNVRTTSDGETSTFFRRLERLVWLQRIASVDPERQVSRYLAVLSDIDSGAPVDTCASLAVEPKLKARVLSALDAVNFRGRRVAPLVLRRLCLDGEMPPADPSALRPRLTVEHILPQNPPDGSEWLRAFGSMRKVKDHTNRLGNLTLLTAVDNHDAGNLDWPSKAKVLGSSLVSLSREAATVPEWTPEVIRERSRRLTCRLMKEWGLIEA
ncbi:MAG: DUF262 domain-containing HNH endonuclease family protein [Hyphomicrobiaceae bacterium]|nr:DUF262 domain-containing HNH endonuclease family protein [Hyphomicrobiaceae bacterium]